MSDPTKPAELESLGAIEAQVADFLQRRRLSRWTEADTLELDAWLAESTAHRVAYLRFQEGEALIERVVGRRPVELDGLVAHRPRRFVVPLLLAASIALIAVLGVGVSRYLSQPPGDRLYSTDVGGRALIDFSDGTQLTLNTDTALRVRMTNEERAVWLEKGEAYFRVAHDMAHPFSVYVGNRRVTDLGTEFLIRSDTGRFEVALVKGRAALSTGGTRSQVAMLTPGDEVVATPVSTSFTWKTPDELADELSWQHGVVKFRHTRLAEAIAEFNRYSRTKLVIDDPVVAQMAIGGDFRTNNINEFLNAMQVVLKLRVEREGNDILIARAEPNEQIKRAAHDKRAP